VTHPCASLTESVLNSFEAADIHGLDLSLAPGTPEEKAAALAATNGPGGVLAFGVNVTIPDAGPAGPAVELRAYQFYMRVRPDASAAIPR
jgi:hypothetical protein